MTPIVSCLPKSKKLKYLCFSDEKTVLTIIMSFYIDPNKLLVVLFNS